MLAIAQHGIEFPAVVERMLQIREGTCCDNGPPAPIGANIQIPVPVGTSAIGIPQGKAASRGPSGRVALVIETQTQHRARGKIGFYGAIQNGALRMIAIQE